MKKKLKLGKILLFNALIFLGLFEIASASFLRDYIRNINEDYLSFGVSRISSRFRQAKSGQGGQYYYSHSERGFDIAPNVLQGSQKVGSETGSFAIWSNGLGCFDLPVNPGDIFKIYLAGDSYTWGFADYEDISGTLLEKDLGVPVASCGVSHTGTRHQFEKFKEISSKLNYFPSLVVVNVYENDIENDFLHPHTTTVDGVRIDIAHVGRYTHLGQPFARRLDVNQILSKKQVATGSKRANSLIQNLSATASLVTAVPELSANFWRTFIQKIPEHCHDGYIYSSRKCFNRLKGYPKSYYPLLSSFGEPHRSAISDWVQHSKGNGYKLMFSFIDFRLNGESREEFCRYVESLDSPCWSFGDFLKRKGVRADKVSWPDNEHFNIQGHRLYADHLIENLRKVDY